MYLCAVFQFKQFTVDDSRCAQKVGTDSVLLGAWAQVEGARRILDIGTGSGLLALMAAQRAPKAQVVGVEIDPQAVCQARENVAQSPFRQRIEIVEQDVKVFRTQEPFDCILSNPPYFLETTLPPDDSRALARHAQFLTFSELTRAVDALLSPSGSFHVILPSDHVREFVTQMLIVGLNLTHRCLVRTVLRKPPRRTLLTFSRIVPATVTEEELILQQPDGSRTDAYNLLAKDFYL